MRIYCALLLNLLLVSMSLAQETCEQKELWVGTFHQQRPMEWKGQMALALGHDPERRLPLGLCGNLDIIAQTYGPDLLCSYCV